MLYILKNLLYKQIKCLHVLDILVYLVNNTIHVSKYSGVWVKRFCLQPRPQTDHKFTVWVMLLIFFMGSLSLMHNSEMKAVSSLSYKYKAPHICSELRGITVMYNLANVINSCNLWSKTFCTSCFTYYIIIITFLFVTFHKENNLTKQCIYTKI